MSPERFVQSVRLNRRTQDLAVLERQISSSGASTVLTVRSPDGDTVFCADLGDIAATAEWRPQEDLLAYTSIATDGTTQVQLLTLSDLSVTTLSRLAGGVDAGHLSWAPDGRSLLATSTGRPARDQATPIRVTRRLWRHDEQGLIADRVNDVYVVGVDATTTPIGLGGHGVRSQPRWSPTGEEFSYLEQFSEPDTETPCPALKLWTRASQRSRQLLDDSWGWIITTAWTGDAARLLVMGNKLTPSGSVWTPPASVWAVDTVDTTDAGQRNLTPWLPGGAGSRLHADSGMSWPAAASQLCLLDDDTLLFTAEHEGRTYVTSVDVTTGDPGPHQLTSDAASFALLDVAETGTPEPILLVAETALDVQPRLLTTAASSAHSRASGDARASDASRYRHLKVPVGDGTAVDTWLVLPGPADQGPYPTVLKIHGGPYASTGDTWSADVDRLAGAGFAVAAHNFRGSYGYGKASADRISRDWGVEGETEHHAVLDHLVSLGITDPDRIGVMGHSHGAFATCWLVSRSRRFAAAVSENPVTNFHDSFFASDIGFWYFPKEFAVNLADPPDLLLQRSPIVYAQACTTPTLLIQSEQDLRCLPGQSDQMYAALWDAGCEVEMLRLPAANHSGSYSGSHGYRETRIAAEVDWFTRHLTAARELTVAANSSPRESVPASAGGPQ